MAGARKAREARWETLVSNRRHALQIDENVDIDEGSMMTCVGHVYGPLTTTVLDPFVQGIELVSISPKGFKPASYFSASNATRVRRKQIVVVQEPVA